MTLARLFDSLWKPQERGMSDRGLAVIIGVLYFCWLLSTVEQVGYARDEGFYFQAALSYQRWFELAFHDPAMALRDVDRYWTVNSEHPGLIKSAFALSHWLLHDRLKLFQLEGTSYRVVSMAFGAAGVSVLYLWGARSLGRLAGLLAAVWLAALPRYFFHAHLACFDVPIVSVWLLCAYAYWRSLRRGGTASYVLCGVAFAMALNTKHNSWFLPIVCGGHAALLWLPGVVADQTRASLRWRAMSCMAWMVTLGPLLFYLSWPWIWHDTALRLRAYAAFHLEHVYYNMEYLGQNFFRPPMPRSYAFVMTAVTVPLTTLVAFVIGLGLSIRRLLGWLGGRLAGARLRRALTGGNAAGDTSNMGASNEGASAPTVQASTGNGLYVRDPATLLLWSLALMVQYAAWLRPTTPIFGGTKHWMTAYPFLSLIAAMGACWALKSLFSPDGRARPNSADLLRKRVALTFAAVALLLLPPVAQARASHPWGLSWYNVLAGGAAGGATLGLNRGFWGYTTLALADEINQRVPPGGSVFIHDTAIQAWSMLVQEGRMRQDIRPVANITAADVAIYHHEKHMQGVEYQQWDAFGTVQPVAVAGLDGVPVIWLYERRHDVDEKAR